MLKATGFLHRYFLLGESSPDLFGGFVEHMGRSVYGGLYEKGHVSSDEEGFRGDVLALVRELSMPVMRYPGGNFVSAYDWRSGIGPKEHRRPHFDPAWGETESNEFALDEFCSWCAKAGTEPALAMNLGTGTEEMALALFDYCNGNGGDVWSKKRKQYASEKPYNVRYFFLGNEMSSPRQIGHKSAEEYGTLAADIARKFKEKDPSCRLVLSGSSCRGAASYGYWDETVLEKAYEETDLLSLHAYFGPKGEDLASFLASDLVLDAHIEEVTALCDAVAAKKKSKKKLFLSLDEWNIWSGTNRAFVPGVPDFEDVYTALDAVTLGGLFMSILSHCSRLKLACLAQTCNILAPIMTRTGGGAWKQTIFHPFALTSRYGRGKVLQSDFSSPENCRTPSGETCPACRLCAVFHEKEKRLALFLLNRAWEEESSFSVELGGFVPEKVLETFLLSAEDPGAVNEEGKERVAPRRAEKFRLKGNLFRAVLPARSWALFLVQVK